MVICHCAVVTDRDVVEAVADGVTSLGAACQATRAGTMCGRCIPTLRTLLCAPCPLDPSPAPEVVRAAG